MKIPFVKAHGGGNDFLFTYADELPAAFPEERFAEAAQAAIRSRGTLLLTKKS